MATYYSTSSSIGVDLNNTSSSSLFTLGQKLFGSNNSEWTYVYATGALSTGMVVGIQSAGTALPLSIASACSGAQSIGVANGAFSAGDYGWVATRGVGVTVAISASGTLAATLYIATTSGYLSTTGGSATLAGVELLAAGATATLTTTTAILTWPRCVSAGMG